MPFIISLKTNFAVKLSLPKPVQICLYLEQEMNENFDHKAPHKCMLAPVPVFTRSSLVIHKIKYSSFTVK